MSFDLYNRPLKIREPIGTKTPKVGVHLRVWGFICGMKRGSIKSDLILGFVSSNSVWRRSIMGCMELHGFSFELCIGMGMAAGIDEGRWQVGERRIGSG